MMRRRMTTVSNDVSVEKVGGVKFIFRRMESNYKKWDDNSSSSSSSNKKAIDDVDDDDRKMMHMKMTVRSIKKLTTTAII